MHGGGTWGRKGRRAPGGWVGGGRFPWCRARCEGHVAKHQISWAAGLGGVRLCSSKNGIIKCSRGISVFLCSLCWEWVARPHRARIKRDALKGGSFIIYVILRRASYCWIAPYKAAWLYMNNCTWFTKDCLNGWLMQHSKWHKSLRMDQMLYSINTVILVPSQDWFQQQGNNWWLVNNEQIKFTD